MNIHRPIKEFLVLSILWLRITLSHCVIGALLVALISAYFQEINIALVIAIMLVALFSGVYSAEKTRRTDGLKKYQQKLHQQKHLQY